MEILGANFRDRSYKLLYGQDVVQKLIEYLPKVSSKTKFIIVSNEFIKNSYGGIFSKILKNYNHSWFLIPDGEANKNLETVNNLYKEFISKEIDKGSYVIGFGGGVLQDILTYACATYRRGIPLVQIPTTVLSQADIGVGGCALDFLSAKSLIGTFYQPALVISDVSFLKGLPKEQYINGYAEIINKILCLGGQKVDEILNDISNLYGDPDLLSEYVSLSAEHKVRIIEGDETGAGGMRIMVDFGHTVTYALEAITNFTIMHGFALGIGMNIAATLSYLNGYLEKDKVVFLKEVVKKAGLPTKLPEGTNVEDLIDRMKFDQKTSSGEIRFILLKDFGQPFMSGPISREQIKEAINVSESL